MDKGSRPGPLGVLQTVELEPGIPSDAQRRLQDEVREAAAAIAYHKEPTLDEGFAHQALSRALTDFLVALVQNCPPGPERSIAIARAREAKSWASAGVAIQRLSRGDGA